MAKNPVNIWLGTLVGAGEPYPTVAIYVWYGMADSNQWTKGEICQRKFAEMWPRSVVYSESNDSTILTECSDRKVEAVNYRPSLEHKGVGTNSNAKVQNKVDEALLERQRCRLESICEAWLSPIICRRSSCYWEGRWWAGYCIWL